VLVCDSNIRLAIEGALTGHTQAVALTPRELRDVEQREAAVYSGAAAIFTLSERTRRSFIDGFGLPPEQVHTVHAGPNFDTISFGADDLPHDHAPTVLFVGRRFERKGGDVLLAAFREVKRQIPTAVLTIVGPDELGEIEPGVVSLGFLSKDQPEQWAALVAAYRAADVFCLPTRFEPLGIAFIEAMHFALPCIGTDASAVREMVVDGETGFIVPPDDVPALTERLLRLLRDRSLARRMGAAGRSRAQRCFSWAAVADRMLGVLRPLLRPAGGGVVAAGS
jgi:glycosyltransferase involved in cell wall biosynthesis